jgi:cysteine desulfuration protein SufE
MPTAPIDDIMETFALLDDWEDRYRYIIDLGRSLDALPEEDHSEANKVRGCASQVWLKTHVGTGPDPVLTFEGDSDALIVKGLMALVLAAYSGRRASGIRGMDALALFEGIGLKDHLSPQRSNGLRSMVERIRHEAAALSGNAGA